MYRYFFTVDCSQSASLSLVSWAVLAEELHRTTDTPSTATTQLRNLCLFRGQSWLRTHTKLQTRNRFLPITAPSVQLLGNLGEGPTLNSRYTVDCNHSTAHIVLVSWAVLVEDLQSKRLPLLRGIAFLCRSIIQTPPFQVA